MLAIPQTGEPRRMLENAQSRSATAQHTNPTLTLHDDKVLASRAISPTIARARGYRSISEAEARDYGFPAIAGLLIPSHGTQGEIERYQLRPHTPSIDPRTGKPRKYLWLAGSRQSIDVPPTSLATLRDVDIPVLITESPLKADAILTSLARLDMDRLFCVLAIAGVFGWRSAGMALSDHGDIPWRRKTADRITFRRRVFLVFDSDTAKNWNVSRARWEYGQFLRRRGASVQYIDVPPDRDGGKQGVDDALAAGHDLKALIAGAYPAPDIMPGIDPDTAGDDDEASLVERLQARIAALERENGNLVRTAKNPHLTDTTRALLLNAGTLVLSKASRGKVEPDGRVRLSAAELSGDFRPKPQAGEARMKTNPDGSSVLMTRSSVKKVATEARALGLIDFEVVKTRKDRGNGRPYYDDDILITAPGSLAEFIAPAAVYAPSEPRVRKDYRHQEPCPACGEVHEQTVKRQTICGSGGDPGCGAIVRETALTVPVPPADRVSITDEQRGGLKAQTTSDPVEPGTGTFFVPIDCDDSPSSPAPNYLSGTFFVPVPVHPSLAPGEVEIA